MARTFFTSHISRSRLRLVIARSRVLCGIVSVLRADRLFGELSGCGGYTHLYLYGTLLYAINQRGRRY